MKSRERYKHLIKFLFGVVLTLGLGFIYGYIWINYYNRMLQDPFWRRGNWMIIFIYMVLLSFFIAINGGYKISILKKGNLIYSQILALVFTNFITYFQTTVIDKRFITAVPIFVNAGISAGYCIVVTFLFAAFYKKLFGAKKMLMIFGDRNDYHLMEKMNTRGDKYDIDSAVYYKTIIENVASEVTRFDAVIVGDIPSHERNIIIKKCFQLGIRTYSVPKISDILIRSSDDFNMFDSPLLLSRNIGLAAEQEFFKRFFDIIFGVIFLVLTSPIFLVVAISIKLTDHGPVFYKQKRLTKDGKVFEILKFRTMVQNAEKMSGPTLATENDPRILPVGRVLRSCRLDELPQLLNIIKGDMSLVGPRPERPELATEICKEIPEFDYRLKVKAGLTGYAQVYGKYSTTNYDKLKLDLTYIRNYSLLLDFKLVLMTPKILFIKEASEGVKEDNV